MIYIIFFYIFIIISFFENLQLLYENTIGIIENNTLLDEIEIATFTMDQLMTVFEFATLILPP